MKEFKYQPQLKSYVMFRMYAKTRDMFKHIANHYGLSVIELLRQLAEQLLDHIEQEAKVDNPDDRQSLQDPSGVKSSAVADPETVEPERTGENSQERGQDGTPVS